MNPTLAAIALALLLSPSALAAGGFVTEQARPADAFVDSIGVNVHLSYLPEAYFQHYSDVIKPLILNLGVRNVRDGLNSNWTPQVFANMRDLAHTGIRFSFITNPSQVSAQRLEHILTDVIGASHIASVEGINEPDNGSPPGWQAVTLANQKAVYDAVKSNPATKAIPVYGPSLTGTDGGTLPGIAQFMDAGNIHPYMGGRNPETNGWGNDGYGSIAYALRAVAAPTSGGLPVAITECGLHNAVKTTNGFKYTPIDVSAKYIPRMFFTYFNDGIVRSYVYELMDEGADAANVEDNFGLVDFENRPKPSYTALRNLIALLKDPGPAMTRTGSLSYTLSGATTNVMHTLLEKRDGSFYLAIWLAVQDWDPDPKVYQTHPDQIVTLSLGRRFRRIDAAIPNDSATWSPMLQSRESVTLPVQDKVTIVRLTP